MMMKKTVLLVSLFVLCLSTSAVIAENMDEGFEKRLVLAKEYSKVIPTENEVKKAIKEVVVRIPVEKRALLQASLERSIKVDRLKTVSELALAETFTEKELEALVAFYKTPEGQAVQEKMPEYKKRLTPVLQEMIRAGVESFSKQN